MEIFFKIQFTKFKEAVITMNNSGGIHPTHSFDRMCSICALRL